MRKLFCPAAVIAALLCAAPAQATPEETSTVFPMTSVIYNACNGDVVLFNADQTNVLRQDIGEDRMRFETYAYLTNVRANATESGRPYDVQDISASRLNSRQDKNYYRSTMLQIIVLKPQADAGGQSGEAGRAAKETLRVLAYSDVAVNTTTGEYIHQRDYYRSACL